MLTTVQNKNKRKYIFQNILTQRSPSPQCHNVCLLSFYTLLNTKTMCPRRVGNKRKWSMKIHWVINRNDATDTLLFNGTVNMDLSANRMTDAIAGKNKKKKKKTISLCLLSSLISVKMACRVNLANFKFFYIFTYHTHIGVARVTRVAPPEGLVNFCFCKNCIIFYRKYHCFYDRNVLYLVSHGLKKWYIFAPPPTEYIPGYAYAHTIDSVLGKK